MPIRVIADGADGHRLIASGDDLVGWVRGRVIGATGFATEKEAIEAAVASYRTLLPWLEGHRLQPLPPLADEPTLLAHDGVYRWIVRGRRLVARLPQSAQRPRGEPACHSFEIVLHGTVSEGMAIHAALIAVRAAHGRLMNMQT